MEKNIYQNRINLYINELDKVDLANPLVVLEWFYKVSDASIMFQISEVSDLIYTKLINNGYGEVLSSEEEAKTYYSLINARMINLDDLARNIIALILKSIKEHKSIDLTVQSFIKIFNEKFNAEDIFNLMMERLKNNIGTRIVATIVVNNEFILKVGTLNQVNDYVSIIIDEETIPFIGKNVAISKINNINGNSLYNNSRVIPSMDLSNVTNITRLNEEIFKDNYRQAVAKVI